VEIVFCGEWTDSLYTTDKFHCFVRITEQRANFAFYCINWFVFITVVESDFCAEWTDSLYTADKIQCFVRIFERERILLYTALTGWFYNCGIKCLLRGMD
jgi:hypothetical protein